MSQPAEGAVLLGAPDARGVRELTLNRPQRANALAAARIGRYLSATAESKPQGSSGE